MLLLGFAVRPRMTPVKCRWLSGDGVEILSESLRVLIGKKSFNRKVSFSPDRNGAGKQPAPLGRQRQGTTAAVLRVYPDLQQTPALQWFDGCGQRGSVHPE